jgi:photosystem II stability/assembly factor-like uncharacterized protein
MSAFSLRASVLFLLVAAGCGPLQAPAQSGRDSQGNTLDAGGSLPSVTAIAVGELGTILRTTDGGLTWTTQDSGTTDGLLGVAFGDTSVGAAVGDTILQTTDAGATWKRNYNWIAAAAVYFLDANNGWAVGGSGPLVGLIGRNILHTTDGGATWPLQFQLPGLPKDSRGLSFADGSKGWLVGRASADYGYVYRTTDGGATWTFQTTEYGAFNGTSFVDANTGWAVGGGSRIVPPLMYFGTIFNTSDGGATWTQQWFGYGGEFYAVSFVDANIGTVVGRSGRIFRTTDAGATWIAQDSGTTNSLFAVSFVDADTGIAVGESGSILLTTDGGATWIAQDSGTTNTLYGVAFAVAKAP